MLRLLRSTSLAVVAVAVDFFMNFRHKNATAIVDAGVLPILVDLLTSTDTDIQIRSAELLADIVIGMI